MLKVDGKGVAKIRRVPKKGLVEFVFQYDEWRLETLRKTKGRVRGVKMVLEV
jgi:hypothetical protein